MKTIWSPLALGALLLSAPIVASTTSHRAHHFHARQHAHQHPNRSLASPKSLQRRSGECEFPTNDPNLVAVTPGEANGGWAMSPDQECLPGNYCPIACKSGMVMNQWKPNSVYTYPSSMDGGLYCNEDGVIEQPFDRPNCVQGTGSVEAVNKCGSKLSFCQTVLPGNEAMLIPTLVESKATIAVPDDSYWASTAAHFYVNPPGTGTEGCIWGTDGTAIGNWAPLVAGANTVANGNTFVTISWNPVWLASSLSSKTPDYGLEVVCPDGGCTGLPCKIDPSEGSGTVMSLLTGNGADNAKFCTVTVPAGKKANIVAFNAGSGGSNGGSDDDEEEVPEEEEEPTQQTTVQPTTTAQPTTSSQEPTTSSTTSSSSTSTSSSAEPTTSTSEIISETSTVETTTEEPTTTSSSSARPTTTRHAGIFHEDSNDRNTTSTASENTTDDISEDTTTSSSSSSEDDSAPASTSEDDEEGQASRRQGNGAVVSLVVAFIAAACFF